ncbi:hypothetical protein V1264_024948 [Littorina saxatilis]|uniref:Uncharacterized protein n=1 Tax=Littorina saxatilis TaxID=31220 RepID=A0AAN9AMZ9_9CAEN
MCFHPPSHTPTPIPLTITAVFYSSVSHHNSHPSHHHSCVLLLRLTPLPHPSHHHSCVLLLRLTPLPPSLSSSQLCFTPPSHTTTPLSKRDQVILFRLRTGHNRLNAHMYSKFRIGESEMCSCNADIMNAEHLLQNCRLHDAPRQASWPEPVPLRVKLFGGLEDLQRTAAFVRAIGISI